jgi:hypothetical protein
VTGIESLGGSCGAQGRCRRLGRLAHRSIPCQLVHGERLQALRER